jgi:membrane protease YdiL (CAAX protease family)
MEHMRTCATNDRAAPCPVGQTGGVTSSVEMANPPVRHRGPEVLAVLGVSLGLSGVYALLSYLRAELTVKGGISATTATVASGAQTSRMWLDIAYDLAGIVAGLMPVVLVLVLLSRDPGTRGFGIGLHRRPERRDVLQGMGFAALIGIPGLVVVWAAHSLGVSANLTVVNVPDTWYRVPLLLLQAAQNGALEEIVVVGYVLTRLRQMGWTNGRALGASALLRGSYHLYQGLGGFAGNLLMGLIFAWWFQRTRRVLPLVVAHFLLDTFAFIGYLYLRKHVSWI